MNFGRVLLKLSGEMLGRAGESLDASALEYVAGEVAAAARLGAQLAVVVGGGNIVRGAAFARQREAWRIEADHMGMLATAINALSLRLQLEAIGAPAKVMSAWPLGPAAEPFDAARGRAALDAGQILLLACGTGNPFFTTDTAAALRALEIDADILLKATNVDGVYDRDPNAHADAKRYDTLTYDEAIAQRLRVMDQTAFALCRDHRLPILVFNLQTPGNVAKAVAGEPVGTIVKEG